MRRNWPRRIAWAGATLLTALVIVPVIAGSFFIAPRNFPVGPPPDDLKAEIISFRNAAGTKLCGWFVRGKSGGGAVVLLHGVRGSRLQMVDRARWLAANGYSVLLFDLQASGESGGDAITFGYRESEDAVAAVAFLRERLPHEKIGVIGASLGGAAALVASSPLPVDAYVIESVFPTITDAIRDRVALHLPWFAAPLATLLLIQFQPRLGFSPTTLRPEESIRALQAPVFVIAGTQDRHTLLTEAKRLFDAAPEPKQFWAVQGAAHEDLFAFAGDEYRHRVGDFLYRYLRGVK